jgi:hypothetical protein
MFGSLVRTRPHRVASAVKSRAVLSQTADQDGVAGRRAVSAIRFDGVGRPSLQWRIVLFRAADRHARPAASGEGAIDAL